MPQSLTNFTCLHPNQRGDRFHRHPAWPPRRSAFIVSLSRRRALIFKARGVMLGDTKKLSECFGWDKGRRNLISERFTHWMMETTGMTLKHMDTSQTQTSELALGLGVYG
jgi:hypothetical protein